MRAFTSDQMGGNLPVEYAPWTALNSGRGLHLASANDPIAVTIKADVNPRPEQGEWEFYVVGSDGVRHTMLGFPTEADAEAWIAADQATEEPSQRRSPE